MRTGCRAYLIWLDSTPRPKGRLEAAPTPISEIHRWIRSARYDFVV
jgi:hypothetical protein